VLLPFIHETTIARAVVHKIYPDAPCCWLKNPVLVMINHSSMNCYSSSPMIFLLVQPCYFQLRYQGSKCIVRHLTPDKIPPVTRSFASAVSLTGRKDSQLTLNLENRPLPSPTAHPGPNRICSKRRVLRGPHCRVRSIPSPRDLGSEMGHSCRYGVIMQCRSKTIIF
jgi:hypothetical protein